MENNALFVVFEPHSTVSEELCRTLRQACITSISGYRTDGLANRDDRKRRHPALASPQALLLNDVRIKPRHLDNFTYTMQAVAASVTADLTLQYRLNLGNTGLLVLEPVVGCIKTLFQVRQDIIDSLHLKVDPRDFSNYIRIGTIDNPDEQNAFKEAQAHIEFEYPVSRLFARINQCGGRTINRSFLIPTNWHN